MANSECNQPDRQNQLAKIGATIDPPGTEFEQELCLLHAAAVEYARANWPSDAASIRGLARTGIFHSSTREEFTDRLKELLISASDGDPRVKALGLVLFAVAPFRRQVKAWKSLTPGTDDRNALAMALAYPHPGPKEAEEEIRLLKALLVQENEAAFQAAFASEMSGSPFQEGHPDVVPPRQGAGDLGPVERNPERPALKVSKRGRPAEYNWDRVKIKLQEYKSENGPIETVDELLQKCGDFASELHPKAKRPDDKTIRHAFKTHGLHKA